MKSKNLLFQTIIIGAALLLLGGLGAYWPSLVGANSLGDALGPAATIGDAITYQGYLTDENDVPLNGTFTMRFQIYNAKTGGTLLWDSGNSSITVNDGLFETRLGITTDIFNGEELWLAQTINGELLTPRQEMLPAPMAHTLRPGAIIKGTANAVPNNYMLDVQMNNDAFAFNRGAISGQTTTGNAIYGLAANGRAIYGQTEDGYAIYGFDGGSKCQSGLCWLLLQHKWHRGLWLQRRESHPSQHPCPWRLRSKQSGGGRLRAWGYVQQLQFLQRGRLF